MKKWLVVLIAVMALCLAVGSALAAGETLPDWRSVENPRIAIKGETVNISTGIGTGYEAIKLVVKDTSDWGTKKAEIQNVSNAVNGKLSFSIDTSADEFEAGHLYTTELFAIPTGKTGDAKEWEGYWDSVLTVVPTGVTGLQIYMNKTEMETGYNGYFVTAYDPNATNVWIVLDGEAYQSRPGNSITWVNGYGEPGTHKVSAISMNAEGVKTTADEQTFSVVQNDDPTLYAQNVTPVTFTMGNKPKSLDEFPETITAGTDIIYTIHRVTKDLGLDAQNLDQQVWYDSWLDDFTDGDGSLELPCFEKRYEPEVAHGKLLNDETGDQTVTIDHSKLITGHTYQLNVEIRSAGRSTVWYSKTFVVLPAEMNNQGITLSFTGDDADKSSVNYPVFDDFTLHASTPGATLVRFWAADHFEYLNHWTGRIGQEEFDIEWKTWWTSEFKYFVQAYYGEIGETPWDELDWDVARTSNILTVKAVRDDNVQSIRPTFGQLSDTVKQGEYFTVSITNADELDSAGIYVGANLYNGNDIDNHYDRTGNKILVPTTDLEPGYYILGIYTETTGGDYLVDQHCFRVVAPDVQPENNFMITTTAPKVDGKYTVQSYEEFSVSFYAPDKEGYNKYYRFNDGQGWWWDNWFERSMTLDVELDPGTWGIYAEVVYEPKNGNGEELRYESEHIQITATSLGDSGIMLDAPGSYMVGSNNGYTVTIKNSTTDELIDPKQYNEEYWEVILEEVNGPGHMEFRRDNGDQLQSSFTFPDDQFTAGKTYKVRIHLNVPGYDSADDEVCFAAVEPEEVNQSKLELVVNEYNTGSSVSWIPAHTNVNVKVNKSDDITAVRVLNGDNWEIWHGNDSYERDWSFGYGIYGIVAQGTTQEPVWEEEGFDWDDFDWDKDVNWTITSNTVTIRFNAPKGKLGMPTLSLDKDEYTRGEIITATVGKVDGTEWYDLKAIPIDENGNEDWSRKTELHMDMDGSGEGTFNFAIRTAHMEPGTYRIWVDNNGTGYNGNGSQRIEVEIKAGSQAPTAVLDIPATISTNTNVPVYAYVPGADWIWVEIRKEGDPGWRNEFNDSQGQNAWTWEFGEAFKGTYLFTLYGKVDGEDVKAVGPVSVEVMAPNGELNDAEITVNTKTITIGSGAASSGVSGSFTKDSRAEWYQVRLVYRGPNGDWGDDEIKNDFRDGENIGTSFTYDKTDFRRGAGVYEVQVIGGATGYNGKHNSIRILALEATTGEIELETRKDDGTTGSSLSVQANENFTIRVHAPEATAIRMYDGERWHWWDGRCLNDNGVAEFGWSLNSGNYLFVAQAAYDEGYDWENFNDWEHFDSNNDLHWTATSNQVSVSVSAGGETDQPVIAKIGTVTRGELLKVTVTSAGAANSEKRATSVDASIRNEDGWNIGEGIGSGQLEADDYPYTFQFPTGDLEAGSYYVYVYGHTLGYNTTEAFMEFEVTEPENGAFIFEIPDELVSQRDFSMSAYAEGAYQIDVNFHQIDREDDFTWDFEGDHIYNTRANLNAGLYEIQAVAHYQDEAGNETGTRTSDTILREVIWIGQLADPEIDAQSSYPVSEGGVFTVSNLGQGSYWWVEIFDTDRLEENEDGNMVWDCVARWDPNTGMPEGGFPISTEYLIAGHSYRISAVVMQEGFEDGTEWKSFVAVGTSSGNVTLSVDVPDGYSLDHWPSSKNIHMSINAPGSSAIRIWDNNNWNCRDSRGMDEDGDYYVDFNYNDVGVYTLVAQASYDKNPDDSDIVWENVDFREFDWNSMTWSDMSNTVMVTIYANGQVGEPTFTAPDAVKTGDDIEITITNRQPDQWYNATIQDQNGWDVIRQLDMEEDKPDTIRISTENIDPGQYQLIVWTDTEGKLGQEARSSIVIDDLSNAAVFTLPAGIAEVEPDAFDGVHMDAVVIQGNHQGLDLSFLNGTGARYLVANEGSITIPNYHSYAVITPEQFNILK